MDTFAVPSSKEERLTPTRHDWTRAEVEGLYALPFADLMFRAQTVHRRGFDPNHVETASLLSIKTGAVPRIAATARRARTTIPA